jgi:hypothetical protein
MGLGESAMMFVLSKKNPRLSALTEMRMHALTITADGKDRVSPYLVAV